jgi:hypothetical protein
MPAIFTYPPSGSAFTPYSMSFRVNDQSFGPNPMKYCSTLKPNARAAT